MRPFSTSSGPRGGFDAVDAAGGEIGAGVREEGDRFVKQVGGQRDRHGEFEVALARGGGEGGIISNDALADHE